MCFRSPPTRRSGAATRSSYPDDPRNTPVGKRMRRFSIDEVPEFWTVLAGDMSLDVQILLRTVPVVLTARGAHSSSCHET